MSISLKTNVSSLRAQANLNSTSERLNRSIERLSSGNRILNAQDDPAGLAIGERLITQIRGNVQNQKNVNDGISALQIAEGGMNEISEILLRMRELTLQASNGTLTLTDRLFLNTEFSQLKVEVDRIAASTKYNNIALLSGGLSVAGLILQVGLNNVSSDRMTINIKGLSSSDIGTTANTINDVTISQSAGQARSVLSIIDAAINDVSEARSIIGAQLSRLNSTIRSLAVAHYNLSSAKSRIQDVDVAEETAEMTRNQILMQAGVSVLAQANNAPQIALSLIA